MEFMLRGSQRKTSGLRWETARLLSADRTRHIRKGS